MALTGKNDKPSLEFYEARYYNYQFAEAYLRFSEKQVLQTASKEAGEAAKLEMRLVQSTQGDTWPLSHWGVLGLSPRGSFFSYLSTMFDETPEISVALKYRTKDKKASEDDLAFDLQAYLNPVPEKHFKDEDVIGKFPIDGESESWYVEGSLRLPDSEFSYPTQRLCLDTFTNEWIGIIEGEIWCQRVRTDVCNSSRAKDCRRENANLELAPKIELIIQGQNLSIAPSEYIYFDKDGLQCRFGDPCTARDQESCPHDTEVVLGKMFFEKYAPILGLNQVTGQRTVTLVRNFQAPRNKKVIWISVGVAAGVMFVGLVICAISRRKRASDERHYVKV